MRILKLFAIALGGLVALLAIVLLAVRAFVNPNDYKDRIARAVKTSTGRELALPGDIRLSVFPWIALELGPASLGNPPGFGEEPFAAVKHAALRVRLLPLLRKQLEIGRVEVDGLDLRLRKNASGRGNWQSPAESSPPTQSSGGAGAAALRDLAGVVVTDSRVSYQDMVAEHINLDVGRVAAGVGVPIKVKLDLIPSAGAQPIEIGGQFGLTLEPAQSRYRLAPMDLEGTFTPGPKARPVPWKFSAPRVELDLTAGTLSVGSVAAQLGAAHLIGTLKGSSLVEAPSVAGSFKLEPLNLRELMPQLGIAPPKTRDPKAFSKLAASGDFAYENKRVGVSKLDVQLDDSQLRGGAAITSLETNAMDFDLTLNQIDIDRYRPPPENAPKAAAPVAKGEPPSSALKTHEMNGRFTLGAATFAGLHVTDGHLELKAKGGVTRIAPLTAKLYGGQYSGEVTLDDRGPVLASSFEQSLTGVDVAQLLKDLTKSQRLSGHGTITSSLTAHGSAGDAVLKSLNGRVAAKLDNGAVEGIDLWFEINRATALIQKQTLTSGASSGRTKFDTFKASADIVNGVATTKDLNIASQNLRLTGQGTTNLVTEAIDYRVKASLLKTAASAAAGGSLLADIPVTITGTMTAPKVRPDLEGLAKAQVQQQLDKHKQEALQKLQDQLKGLLK
ncbi:MAG TPA: AsmA family protein [Steroidobacteraceae bacterium]|nr:AsmA family protein [Steroidobacteraceae bacterium]